MAEESLASEWEENLIPGLPDDISLQCLARISHGYEGIMHCVSKRWRDALRSEDIGRIRVRDGLCGDWIFAHTSQEPAIGWQAYDPAADLWHTLPLPPGFTTHAHCSGFRCVVLRSRLLVLGGCPGPFIEDILVETSTAMEQESNRVFSFDPFYRKWSELPSMKTPRVDFACTGVDGCVLVAGGGSAFAELFDLEKNSWKALPEMPAPLEDCWAMVYKGEVRVQGYNAHDSQYHYFVLGVNEWKVDPQTPEIFDLEDITMTEMDGRLYGIQDKAVMVLDDDVKEWRILGDLPLFEEPSYEWRLPPKHMGFVGLSGQLYLFGGMKIEPDPLTENEVLLDFSAVRHCNPSAGNPIYWHDAPPLIDEGGAIVACAALQQ